MIDTDKYKGHAQGEWTIEMNDTNDECAINTQDYGTIAQVFYRDHDKLFMATSRLIADAPLLLEEVQRLREELFNTHAFYSIMEQKLAFAVGIKQGLLTSISMDDLVDSMNRDYHDRLNEHMDGRLKKND